MKLATLNWGCPSTVKEDGVYRVICPQEAAYREVMGKPTPEPFPEGTLAREQWEYRKDSRRRAADVLAHPKAKPLKKKTATRRGRKPKGV